MEKSRLQTRYHKPFWRYTNIDEVWALVLGLPATFNVTPAVVKTHILASLHQEMAQLECYSEGKCMLIHNYTKR